MVNATKGYFLRTEPSVKEVVLKLGESENFVIEDINETSVFITPEAASDIKERVELIMNSAKNPTKQ
ncbi:subunit Tfb5 of transcription factor TFIIH complex [Ordospora colligata]|uniref:General transcription and DNA repair factor IIH subunit TFB5 n=1 Tax=Ordospora colligata OC4 TaxID=1354746 RepID=A0A0B2UIU9_9MICR|nr:subunit Tfb5 of transcription factor TFIIH complex [Ordospora colligata OC4]KHN68982.1 subunit Tfb5 of transcription factor TFIIH complex [Ordospora colligata OC4]TBU14203.1 subunit Tfb5 of transcription factor TFIIH complex [Ordospora colligata]TBU14257.1 subunit Tfb5 of transcription factor TFIIH complex [Ordospora colligata]TBU17880.1 subunit Tfb5 of transcription factor TFIIH complex [Ordospora colligata]